MRNGGFLLLSCLLLLFSCNQGPSYQVSRHLSDQAAGEFKQRIIHYIAPLPKKATDDTKREARFDSHYQKQTDRFRLDKYYPAKDGFVYFEVSRIAPSFKVKRVATAGRLKLDANGEIAEYEEFYRTWKMEEPELAEKTALLFERLVNGETLTPYLTANSQEEYIEFPDGLVRYDKLQRKWVADELVLQARP